MWNMWLGIYRHLASKQKAACSNPTVSTCCKIICSLTKHFVHIVLVHQDKNNTCTCNGLVSHPGRVNDWSANLHPQKWVQVLWVIMTILKPHSMVNYFDLSFLMVKLKSLMLYYWFQVEGKTFTQEQNLVLTAVLKLKIWKVWNCKNFKWMAIFEFLNSALL